MTVDVSTEPAIRDRLRRRGAQDRLDDLRRCRVIAEAHRSGLTHRVISELLGTVSQATVTRTLRRCSSDPALTRETPAEVIDRAMAGEIGREEMMATLLNWHYTLGEVPSVGGVVTDAYIAGDWDQVERAFYRDLLTDEEFERLAARQGELLDRMNRPR